MAESDSARARIQQQIRLLSQKRLEDNYEKARKRAKRNGRDLPPRDESQYYYWGSPYFIYAPYVYPAYVVCPIYYDTTTVPAGTGSYGACANGSCGATVAAGACGGAAAGSCFGGVGTTSNLAINVSRR